MLIEQRQDEYVRSPSFLLPVHVVLVDAATGATRSTSTNNLDNFIFYSDAPPSDETRDDASASIRAAYEDTCNRSLLSSVPISREPSFQSLLSRSTASPKSGDVYVGKVPNKMLRTTSSELQFYSDLNNASFDNDDDDVSVLLFKKSRKPSQRVSTPSTSKQQKTATRKKSLISTSKALTPKAKNLTSKRIGRKTFAFKRNSHGGSDGGASQQNQQHNNDIPHVPFFDEQEDEQRQNQENNAARVLVDGVWCSAPSDEEPFYSTANVKVSTPKAANSKKRKPTEAKEESIAAAPTKLKENKRDGLTRPRRPKVKITIEGSSARSTSTKTTNTRRRVDESYKEDAKVDAAASMSTPNAGPSIGADKSHEQEESRVSFHTLSTTSTSTDESLKEEDLLVSSSTCEDDESAEAEKANGTINTPTSITTTTTMTMTTNNTAITLLRDEVTIESDDSDHKQEEKLKGTVVLGKLHGALIGTSELTLDSTLLNNIDSNESLESLDATTDILQDLDKSEAIYKAAVDIYLSHMASCENSTKMDEFKMVDTTVETTNEKPVACKMDTVDAKSVVDTDTEKDGEHDKSSEALKTTNNETVSTISKTIDVILAGHDSYESKTPCTTSVPKKSSIMASTGKNKNLNVSFSANQDVRYFIHEVDTTDLSIHAPSLSFDADDEGSSIDYSYDDYSFNSEYEDDLPTFGSDHDACGSVNRLISDIQSLAKCFLPGKDDMDIYLNDPQEDLRFVLSEKALAFAYMQDSSTADKKQLGSLKEKTRESMKPTERRVQLENNSVGSI